MKKQVIVAAALTITVVLIIAVAAGFGTRNKIGNAEKNFSSDTYDTISGSVNEERSPANDTKGETPDISGDNTDGADSEKKEISASVFSETSGGFDVDGGETETDILNDGSSGNVNGNSRSGKDSSDNGKSDRTESKTDSGKSDEPISSSSGESGNSENTSSRYSSEPDVSSSDGKFADSGTIELPIIPMD